MILAANVVAHPARKYFQGYWTIQVTRTHYLFVNIIVDFLVICRHKKID